MTNPTSAAREGARTTVWEATLDAPLPSYPPLAEDLTADVCVVGAGIAGLTTAYLLAVEGKRVVVLDDGPIAGGESGRTTAHFVNALDERGRVGRVIPGYPGREAFRPWVETMLGERDAP